MKPLTKVGLVAAGYVLAVLVAYVVVGIYIAHTNTPDRDTSSGMYAFGDGMLFLGVLGVASIPATAAGLFFLRSNPGFWRGLTLAAIPVVATGVIACVIWAMARATVRTATPESGPGMWAAFSVLRVLLAPLVVMFLTLAGALAPRRSFRVGLLVAAGVEAVAFAYSVVAMVLARRYY